MAESSWPSPAYNSGDLTDTEYEKLAVDGYMPSGLVGIPTDQPLVFGDSSGRQVKFRATRAGIVRGQRWYAGSSDVVESIGANSSGQTRYDLATLRLDRSTQLVRAHIVAGTPGSGVPAPVQTEPGVGADVWDLPCASVKVINGASTIAASDVTPLAWYLGEEIILCTSTTRPPHRFGRMIRESDSGNEFVSDGSSWTTSGEDTGPLSCTIKSGWSAQLNRVSKLDGVIYVNLQVARTGNDLAASTDSQVATLPASCVSALQQNLIGIYFPGGHGVRARVDPNSGLITITDYPNTLNQNDVIAFAAASFRP